MSEKQYKAETGKDALYRVNSSDYHTLHYVKWLQAENKELRGALEDAEVAYNIVIAVTPTGEQRNKITEMNIKRLQVLNGKDNDNGL